MQNGVLTATYGYDANGNRTSVATLTGTKTATYDAQDRLLTYGTLTYTYDANGSLQSKTDTSTGEVTTYAYDGLGNLRHVGLPDGRSIDYLVDSENRRVAKKINGTVVRKWIYEDQLKPAAEFDAAGELVARYLDGVTIKSGVSYRVVSDHLGTPRLLVNSTTGVVAQRLDLDEWGQVTGDTSADFQVFGFARGVYDADTGLVRFGARDYDPVVGRWTAKDPIGFGGRQADLYAYIRSEPINNADRSGLLGPVIAAPAGAFAGAAVAVIGTAATALAAIAIISALTKPTGCSVPSSSPPPPPDCTALAEAHFVWCLGVFGTQEPSNVSLCTEQAREVYEECMMGQRWPGGGATPPSRPN